MSAQRFAALAFFVAACGAPPVSTPDAHTAQENRFVVAESNRTQVDILFLVDNSSSMDKMAAELRGRFSDFFEPFAALAASGQLYADLHIGVVTSDYGAGASGAPGCDPAPGGQRGRLQARGAAADTVAPGCQAPVGANFISYKFNPQGGTGNLPPGQDLLTTFTCMAAVGAQGCGFEHQLESVYAALHDPPAENVGFVRPGALLAVVFLTNEDDGSAPPDSEIFDPSNVVSDGYEDTYRQTRFGVACGRPLALAPYAAASLDGCIPAPAGLGSEYDVSRYVDFFTHPSTEGGIKQIPDDVILVGVDASPTAPGHMDVVLSNPNTPTGMPYPSCAPLDEDPHAPCVPLLQHSCVNPRDPGFFGDPAIRLNTVIGAATTHQITSICDDSYAPALQAVAHKLIVLLGTGCLGSPLANPDAPDCSVEEVSPGPAGGQITSVLPRCDLAGGAEPCWHIEKKAACASLSPEGLGVTIERTTPAPPETFAHVACATIATP